LNERSVSRSEAAVSGNRIEAVASSPPARLVALGWLALAAGALVYLTDRDPSRALLLPAVGSPFGTPLFGAIGLWLPSFVHPFAFSLFTAAIAPPGTRPAYWACALWWAVDAAFEAAQAPALRDALVPLLDAPSVSSWGTNALGSYLRLGTFDAADLLAATAGAIAAALVLHFNQSREKRNAR
jgi:hypothetical protein